MSFLSSVREAASAGLKMAASMASGTSLPFEQGPQITSYQGIMKMYSGKRENKEGVKEIQFVSKDGANRGTFILVQQ